MYALNRSGGDIGVIGRARRVDAAGKPVLPPERFRAYIFFRHIFRNLAAKFLQIFNKFYQISLKSSNLGIICCKFAKILQIFAARGRDRARKTENSQMRRPQAAASSDPQRPFRMERPKTPHPKGRPSEGQTSESGCAASASEYSPARLSVKGGRDPQNAFSRRDGRGPLQIP